MFELKSTDGEGQVLLFPLYKPRMTIGRDPSNDIILTDPDVSRWHALMMIEKNGPVIRDQQSTNGVFVNSRRIHDPMPLGVGDLLILGSNLFAVSENEQDDAALERTMALSKDQIAELFDPRGATSALQETSETAGSFDLTLVRGKHDLLEGAFEKKLQIARFPRLETTGAEQIESCYLLAMPVFRLGRAADCHLRLAAPAVSAHHAEIQNTAAGCLLVDLKSENGTCVNGRRIDERLLRDGDVIELPQVRLVYRHREGLRGRFSKFIQAVFKKN